MGFVKKGQFLKLCDALEKKIITKEQFNVLLDKPSDKTTTIIEILNVLDNKSKTKLFNLLCECDNCLTLWEIFIRHEVYCKDGERQQIIIENFDSEIITEVAILLSNDEIWNNKELVDIILKKVDELKNNQKYKDKSEIRLIFIELTHYITDNKRIYQDKNNIELLKKVFQVNKHTYAKHILNSINVKYLRDNPLWLDYLVAYYSRYEKSVSYSWCFKSFEEAGFIDELNDKLKEINQSSNPLESFTKFIENLITIEKPHCNMNEDEKEKYQDYLNIIFKHIMENKKDFLLFKEVLEIKKDKSLDADSLEQIYKNIKECQFSNVQSFIIERYKDEPIGFFTDEIIKRMHTMSFDEARNYILERAIAINDTNYVNKEKSYYHEYYPESFIEYIMGSEISKEDLLKIREKLKSSTSTFNGERFIINCNDILKRSTDNIDNDKQPDSNIVTDKIKTIGMLSNISQIFTKSNK